MQNILMHVNSFLREQKRFLCSKVCILYLSFYFILGTLYVVTSRKEKKLIKQKYLQMTVPYTNRRLEIMLYEP